MLIVLVITIPVLLLWSVQINIRRKFGLGSLLCLSIFAIIINIIRLSGIKLKNKQDDTVWILFWNVIEACVAVMANSMTAFRSLFAAGTSRAAQSPDRPAAAVIPSEMARYQKMRQPPLGSTSAFTATFSGLMSILHQDPFEDHESLDAERTLTAVSEDQVTQLQNQNFTHTSKSTRRVSASLKTWIM